MENINLIRKIAWSFHRTTGVEWDELFQEAALAYCKGLETYTPERGRITTFMWQWIRDALISYLRHEKRLTEHLLHIDIMLVDKPVMAVNQYENLSRDAQRITEIVFQNPLKYSLLTPTAAQKEIAQIMYKEERWTWPRVRTGLREMREAFAD